MFSRRGLEVVALEAGPRLDPSDDDARRAPERRPRLDAVPKRATRRRPSRGRVGAVGPVPVAHADGQRSRRLDVHYPGLSIRFQPWNFRSRTATLERYGAGAFPAGSTLADWPLDYDELEPYYDAVEHAIGVAGAAGNRRGAPDRRQPVRGRAPARATRCRRSGGRAGPSSPPRRRATLGWHPFPAPAAINSEPYNGNPECTYCGFCSSNGCYRDAKGSTDANVIRWAEATGPLRVEVGARVPRIEVDRDGVATGVTYVRRGASASSPRGRAARRLHLREHAPAAALALARLPAGARERDRPGRPALHGPLDAGRLRAFPGRRLNLYNGLWAQATCVDDWNADNFDHTGLGFVGGGMLAAPQEAKPIAVASSPLPPSCRAGERRGRRGCRHGQSVGYASPSSKPHLRGQRARARPRRGRPAGGP